MITFVMSKGSTRDRSTKQILKFPHGGGYCEAELMRVFFMETVIKFNEIELKAKRGINESGCFIEVVYQFGSVEKSTSVEVEALRAAIKFLETELER